MTLNVLDDLISVIVPVYKVEPYLDRCVQSIVDQTYQNLEIILVDDGSPDNCPAMCDAWAAKDGRVRVIHKSNGGLSDARNSGMSAATGEYVYFVDSDDWISKRLFELLYQAMKETDADLAACDIATVHNEEEASVSNIADVISVHTREEAMADLARGTGFRAVAWNKLYKRTLLENEVFPVGKLHEDEFFTYRIIDKCRVLAYVDQPLYYYFQREGSIMSERSFRHIDALEAYFARQALFRDKYPALYLKDKIMFCTTCVNLYSGLLSDRSPEASSAKDRIKKYRHQVQFTVKELSECTAKQLAYVIGSTPVLLRSFSSVREWMNKKENDRSAEKD